jgi:L-alanine-DL-glutamate epimerase-like enolase superfamily enzyme
VKLKDYRVTRSILSLTTPFHTALRTVTAVEEIRVVLSTDVGLLGVGSAAPTAAITGETAPSIVAALEEYILPALSDQELTDIAGTQMILARSIVGNFSAKAAVDIALHDLYAKHHNESLLSYLGGISRPLWTDATVSLGEITPMVEQARGLVEQGFHHLKVKVGGHDGHDVERVIAVRQAVPETVQMWLDPNQAWTVRESIAAAEVLTDFDIDFIEQPVVSRDIQGLREVTRQSPIPIAADESVFGTEQLLRILDLQAADIVNIKLMKCGGLSTARIMADLVRSAGFKLMVGSMMEGMASVTAAAMFATTYRADYVDLDAAYFLSDPQATGGIQYTGGSIALPTGLGLGVDWPQAPQEE